jgi:hypothetical protein
VKGVRFLVFVSLAAAAMACSSKSSLVGSGGVCQVATDCADGLICVPQKDGSSVCSADLTGVQQLPPKADAGNAAVADSGPAPTPDAAPAPVPDAAIPDAAPTPVPEASTATDAAGE